MCQMVLFIVAVLQGQKDALVKIAGDNLDIGATELGGNLVVASCN